MATTQNLRTTVALVDIEETDATAETTTGTTYRVRPSALDDVSNDGQVFGAIYAIATGVDTGDVTAKIQGSPDGSTWYTLWSLAIAPGSAAILPVTWSGTFIPLYVRALITSAGAEYSGALYLTSNAEFTLVAP